MDRRARRSTSSGRVRCCSDGRSLPVRCCGSDGRSLPVRCCGSDGRSIVEAVVALTLIALATLTWGRMAVTSARTDAAVDHRDVALELAANTIEAVTLLPWDQVGIDPGDPDFVRRFERARTVPAMPGLPAVVEEEVEGVTYRVRRHVTESGAATWRRITVIIEWDEGERTATVRLDGAARAPDEGTA